MIPVAILCGGRGTRISGGERSLPKPLVEIGGKPILWHVMSLYADQGMTEFIALTGWQAELVEQAIAGFDEVARGDWQVQCVNTGDDTPTGERVHLAADHLPDSTFALTYADGVADIDLAAELDFHRAHGGAATMTVVQPPSPWGEARVSAAGLVTGFVEKPRLRSWINGGFFLLEPEALKEVGPGESFEQGPLARLANAGQLHAFRHEGFWDCMDTFKDAILLNELCAEGIPPWRTRGARSETPVAVGEGVA